MATNNKIKTEQRVKTTEGNTIPNNSVASKTISRKFGRPEDYIETHIYNLNNQLLSSIPNFTNYSKSGNTNLTNELSMDPVSILNNNGYSSGTYRLVFNILRKKIFNTSTNSFIIKAISSSRTELRVIAKEISNKELKKSSQRFINEISNSPFLRDFILNFGKNQIIVGVNILLNEVPSTSELIIKLNQPLPNNISVLQNFSIAEEITSPITINQDLGFIEFIDEGVPLKGPNFKIDVRLNNSMPSGYKNYDGILEYEATSSYQNLLNKLENREIPEVQYDFIRSFSGSNEGNVLGKTYHFENFVHFGSALERVKNFKYKMELLEFYDNTINNINTNLDINYQSSFTINEVNNLNNKKTNLLKGLDGYERFLYYESGALSWPKTTITSPHTLHSISSSAVKTWLGDERDTYKNYGGQLLSASLFDRQNEYSLIRLIPNHIVENPNNSFYSTFVNMMGHHYDQIWVHIKHITEVNDSHHTRGISKDLIYFSLKNLGLETFDQFENSNLIEYILGEGTSGSAFYDTPLNQTLVTASNAGSIPKEDITKEIWKRLYHNAPYLLKTKGTERGLKALMSCYGVPATILNVKEYGGSTSDKTTYQTFNYEKAGLALKGNSGADGFFIKTDWSSSHTNKLSASAKTVEFRIKPFRSTSDYHLWSLSGSADNSIFDQHLILEPYIGNDISSSNDSVQYGRLKWFTSQNTITSSTNYFPVYNGDLWNIFIGVDVSNTTASSNTQVKFGAYKANYLKTVNSYTNTASVVDISVLSCSNAWGLDFTNPHESSSAGAEHCYIGGLPTGSTHNDIDGLAYSGSIQEIRYHFGELLDHDTLTKHALEPFMYSGNSPSSSYENVVLRLPLGGNDLRTSESYHPNSDVKYLTSQNTELFRNGTFNGISDTASADNSSNLATAEYGPLFRYPNSAGASLSASIEGGKLKISSSARTDSHMLNNGARFDHPSVIGRSYRFTATATGDTGSIYIYSDETVGSLSFIGTRNIDYIAQDTITKIYFRANRNGYNGTGTTADGGVTFYDNISVIERILRPIESSMTTQTWDEIVETHHLPTPDTVGISTTSEKTRIDTGTIDDNWLSPTKKTETSTLDRQPLDYPDLGIFFSPTTEINEDILYTLGSFRLDDYIGSPLPNQQTASIYEDLSTIKDIYFKKVKRRYNYWDYIKTVQYIDHTLFKLIEQWVPMKANLKTGLLIEPHYLERTKIAREIPTIGMGQSMLPNSYNTFEFGVDTTPYGNKQISLESSSVIANNVLLQTTDEDNQRKEQGTNGSVDVIDYISGLSKPIPQAPINPQLREDIIRSFDDFSYGSVANILSSDTGWLEPDSSTTGDLISGDKSALVDNQGHVSGSYALRIGNTDGTDDELYLISKASMSYNHDTVYEIEVRVKGESNGLCFVGFVGYDANSNYLNTGSGNTYEGQHYIAVSASQLTGNTWGVHKGYVRGFHLSGYSQTNSQLYPTTIHAGTTHISPIIIFNYAETGTVTGTSYIDYIRVTEQQVDIPLKHPDYEPYTTTNILGNASKGKISSRYYRQLVNNKELNF